MANRYWVGGTDNWNTSAATKWATTSGGAGGSAVPTAADDVFFDAASGAAVITLSAAGVCRSLNCTGFTGTFVQNTSINITLGDGTAGASNVALLFVSGMTYTRNASAQCVFSSTSATQQTITTGGKTNLTATFNGVGSSYIFQDAWVSGATIVHTNGTLNTNNQAVNLTSFLGTGALARTLTLGSSAITITGPGVAWSFGTITNLTLNAGTSTITMTGAGATFQSGNGLTYNNLVITGSGQQQIIGISTFNNVTRTGTAAKTDTLIVANDFTVTGTFTVTGNSVTNRMLVYSSTVGTARTITCSNAPVLTNVDFTDITAAGAGGTWTGTSMGDALGNSNITFDTPATQTHTASAGGNWSDATKWTSRVPLPQDDVIVNVNTTGTLVPDMPRLGKSIDFTGFAGTCSFTSVAVTLYGNLTLATGMTFTSTLSVTLAGRSTQTITMNGKALASSLIVNAPGGSYTMQDALSMGSSGVGTFQLGFGGWYTNNFTFTVGRIDLASANIRTFDLGSSTVNITAVTPSANISISILTTNLTAVTSGASLVLTTASKTSRSFGLGGTTWNSLTYTVANSQGPIVITGANTIGTLNIGAERVLTMPSSTVNTFTTFNANGSPNAYQYFPSVAGNYASTPDSAALSVTGDIDIRVRAAMDDWTPAAINMLVSKLHTSGQYSYDLWVNLTTGRLVFRHSSNGTALITTSSTASPVVADGFPLWLRVTRDSVSGDIKFYTAADSGTMPSVWTQLGTTVASAASGIFDGTGILELGTNQNGTGFPLSGKYYQAQIRNNILDDGSGIVFDANFTTKAFGANSFAESSSNAATVTLNGSTLQAGDGRVLLDASTPGTAATISKVSGSTSVDYLTIRDSIAGGGSTWFAGANSVNVSNNTGWNFKVPFELGGSFFHVM